MPRQAPQLVVRAQPDSLSDIRAWLDRALSDWNVAEQVRSDLALALTELCTNIMRHGYEGADADIRLAAEQREGAIRIVVEDRAPHFSPDEAADRKGLLREGGFGLPLIRALTDEFSHEALPGRGNRITLVKRLPASR